MENEGVTGTSGSDPFRAAVDRVLDLSAADRDGLPGLVRLNAFHFPRLRFIGFQLLLLFTAFHLEVFGGGFSWSAFLPLFVGVQVYALAAWGTLRFFFARSQRIDLGDLFVLLDLVVFALVIWWTGGSESHLWPIFLLHTADQLWMGRRRTFRFALLCVMAYALVPLAEHVIPGTDPELASQLWRVGALAGIAFMIAAVAREPLDIQHRALSAREWILRLDRQSRELEEARARAEAANEAKTEFLTRMSHELRTPMNSVIGFANLLLKRPSLLASPQGEVYIQRIRSSGLHLLAMINDLLDVARIEEGKLQVQWGPVALGEVVRETVDSLSHRATERGLVMEAVTPPQVALIQSDEVRVRQVITNLVGNALKFTDQGKIQVELVVDDHAEPVAIQVRDSGSGIREADLERIFLPFEQGEVGPTRNHQGSGLGLGISRAICTELGYSLTVESQVGEGSTFTITLGPRPEPPDQPSVASA